MQNRIPLLLLSIAAATLACTFACDLIQQAAELVQDSEPETVAPLLPDQTQPEPPPSDPLTPEHPTTPDPSSGDAIPPEVDRQMDQIEREVIELRGLQPTRPVARGLLSPEELREYVIDDFLQDYSEQEARDDVRTLALLGLIDPQFDLLNLYLELYNEQIAGFYDDEVEQMFVVQGTGFGGPERITHAHEYAHALQDQTWDLSEGLGFNDEDCEADSEACAAVQALVEGDATLLEEQWLVTYATDEDFVQLREFINSFQSPVLDASPDFLQEDFLFPYQYGYLFVLDFFQDGGWAAVDALYANPPRSTEHILHPESYPDDLPQRLQTPDAASALGGGWGELDRDVLGEWFTRLTLAQRISSQTAETAAAGWGGDYYLSLYDEPGDQGALVLVSAWDTVRDAHEFYEAFREYGLLRYQEQTVSSTTQTVWESDFGWASIEISGDQTRWIHAPESALGEQLRQTIPFPAALSD